jgi:hypothetical protein
MQGFQAGNIDAIRSERIVCVVKDVGLRVKAFQIVFGADGSLFITFPYFALMRVLPAFNRTMSMTWTNSTM